MSESSPALAVRLLLMLPMPANAVSGSGDDASSMSVARQMSESLAVDSIMFLLELATPMPAAVSERYWVFLVRAIVKTNEE